MVPKECRKARGRAAVRRSRVRIAAMTGAIESDYAQQLGIDAMQVASPQDGMDAVANGRADVFALTGISLNWLAQNNPQAPVEVTSSFVAEIDGVPQVGAGGTVFRKEDAELRDAYNAELAKITSDKDKYLSIVGTIRIHRGGTARSEPDHRRTVRRDRLIVGEVCCL